MSPNTVTKSRKKTQMSESHKAALAKGREEGRIVRQYLEALESTKPRRGRKRTPDSIRRRLTTIETSMPTADPLTTPPPGGGEAASPVRAGPHWRQGRHRRPREGVRQGRPPLRRAQRHLLLSMADRWRERLRPPERQDPSHPQLSGRFRRPRRRLRPRHRRTPATRRAARCRRPIPAAGPTPAPGGA